MSKVLIVEDDDELAHLMQRAFEADGISAAIASSAEASYDVLTTSVFDCLVVDVNLPGDDGYALCRNLRERSGVPVVFASLPTKWRNLKKYLKKRKVKPKWHLLAMG